MHGLSFLEFLDLASRVGLAVVLGAAIGLERQWRLRTAGIRTNALVSVGAALFVILGSVAITGQDADPTRVAAQVVSGIGFLGGGVILRDGLNVRGLTTAATLWCAAAIGSLAGAGITWLAVLGCLAIVATNVCLRPISRYVNQRVEDHRDDDGSVETELALEVVTTDKAESRVRALVLQTIARPDITLHSVNTSTKSNSRVAVIARMTTENENVSETMERAVQRISLDPKVIASRWWADDVEA